MVLYGAANNNLLKDEIKCRCIYWQFSSLSIPGGSINKLMYKSKEKLAPKDGKSQRLHIAYVKRDDIDNLAAFIKEKCDTPQHNELMQIYTTGVGGKQFGNEINEKLNVE